MYYYMFDLEKETFITNASGLKEFKKNKKTIVMRNCTTFSKQIIEQLREEEARYKQGKNSDINEPSITTPTSPDITKVDTLTNIDVKKMKKFLKRQFLIYKAII